MLQMESSPSYTDSVEERRRLQGRARTQRHRDAKMRMPEPEEGKVTVTGGGLRTSGLLKLRGVCMLRHRNSSYIIFTSSDFQTTLTTLSGSHLAHTFVLQSAWLTCLCTKPHCACVCLVTCSFQVPAPNSEQQV